MKKYSSNRAQKGKTAYRTPSLFKANKAIETTQQKFRNTRFNQTPKLKRETKFW